MQKRCLYICLHYVFLVFARFIKLANGSDYNNKRRARLFHCTSLYSKIQKRQQQTFFFCSKKSSSVMINRNHSTAVPPSRHARKRSRHNLIQEDYSSPPISKKQRSMPTEADTHRDPSPNLDDLLLEYKQSQIGSMTVKKRAAAKKAPKQGFFNLTVVEIEQENKIVCTKTFKPHLKMIIEARRGKCLACDQLLQYLQTKSEQPDGPILEIVSYNRSVHAEHHLVLFENNALNLDAALSIKVPKPSKKKLETEDQNETLNERKDVLRKQQTRRTKQKPSGISNGKDTVDDDDEAFAKTALLSEEQKFRQSNLIQNRLRKEFELEKDITPLRHQEVLIDYVQRNYVWSLNDEKQSNKQKINKKHNPLLNKASKYDNDNDNDHDSDNDLDHDEEHADNNRNNKSGLRRDVGRWANYLPFWLLWQMGSGKTLAILLALMANPPKRIVIACPNTIIGHWFQTIESIRQLQGETKFVIVGYTELQRLCVEHAQWLQGSVVVLDEAHYYRNLQTNMQYVVEQLKTAQAMFVLTGTPIVHNAEEVEYIFTMMGEEYNAGVTTPKDLHRIMQDHVFWYDPNVHDEEMAKAAFPEEKLIVKHVPMGWCQTFDYLACLKTTFTFGPYELGHSQRNSYDSLSRRISNQDFSSTDLSPKFKAVLQDIIDAWNEGESKRDEYFPWIVFSQYRELGACGLYKQLQKAHPNIRLALISGDTKERQKIVNSYNAGKIDVLFITNAAHQGCDLLHTAQISLVDSHRAKLDEEQTINRGRRYSLSTKRKPYITIRKYISTFPSVCTKDQRKGLEEHFCKKYLKKGQTCDFDVLEILREKIADEKMVVDERFEANMLRHHKLVEPWIWAIRESSIFCKRITVLDLASETKSNFLFNNNSKSNNKKNNTSKTTVLSNNDDERPRILPTPNCIYTKRTKTEESKPKSRAQHIAELTRLVKQQHTG